MTAAFDKRAGDRRRLAEERLAEQAARASDPERQAAIEFSLNDAPAAADHAARDSDG